MAAAIIVRFPARPANVAAIPSAVAGGLHHGDCAAVFSENTLLAVTDEYGTAYTAEEKPHGTRTDLREMVENLISAANDVWALHV